MLNESQLQLFDDLTLMERSIFLYHFVFKMNRQDIIRHLHLTQRFTNKTIKYLSQQIDFLPIREKLIETHCLEN